MLSEMRGLHKLNLLHVGGYAIPISAKLHRRIIVLTRCAAFLAITLLTDLSALAQQPPGGAAPTAINRPLSQVPNEQAITTRFWVPDLDAGFVPQGLAVQGGQVVLAGYRSTDTDQARGLCTVMWVSAGSGRVTRRIALPPSCGHAGGVAAIPGGRLVVADTRMLFLITGGRLTSTVRLGGALRGSFADFDGRDLWLGSYERSGGRLWRIPLGALVKEEVSESDAAETLPTPAGAQGLAFDSSGQMWMTTSGSRDGAIHRLDRRTGQIQATYAAPAGVEDIAFDGTGRLWASSEAGSRRWSTWATFFPLIFALDVSRLR
jgi:hypothetical protein